MQIYPSEVFFFSYFLLKRLSACAVLMHFHGIYCFRLIIYWCKRQIILFVNRKMRFDLILVGVLALLLYNIFVIFSCIDAYIDAYMQLHRSCKWPPF